MFRNDSTMVMRKMHESPHESLMPAMNLKTTPELLMCINFCGILYFLFVTLLIVIVSFSITLPAQYSGLGYWTRFVVAWFILFQIFGNFLLVWRRTSFCDGVSDGTLPGSNWKHCVDCRISVPPRAHHCPLCRHCIAMRDHHCFFTASCIGRDNLRHFIAFCVDCAVGTAYAVHVAFHYVSSFHGDGGFSYFILPVAVVRWMLGWQTGLSVIFVGFTYICLMSCLGSAAVAIWQLFLAVRGQTSHEFNKGRWWNPASFTGRTAMRNIRMVFGPYWPVVFLCPWPIFPTHSDSSYTKSV